MRLNVDKQLKNSIICIVIGILCMLFTMFMTGTMRILLLAAGVGVLMIAVYCLIHVDQTAVIEENEEALKEYSHHLIMTHASHDLRTPMNAILNFSNPDLIKDHNPKELMESMAAINDSGRYMLTLINDLFTLTGIENDENLLHVESTTIASCVEPAIEMMRSRMQAKKQVVTVNYHDVDRYRYVNADPQRVRQIMMNLLSNANKYTPEGGYIDVLVEGEEVGDDVNIRIHVKDNGMGIKADKLNTIRKAYKEKIVESNDVIGLGLSTVFILVNAMKGQLDVNSVEGEGTECIVSLKWTVSSGIEESTYDFSILQGKNVLLVEDNTVNAEIAKVILENKGMTMDLAVNGQQGVAMFTHAMPHTYDLILMDVKMPIMDGLEATRVIRSSTHPEAAQIPIIAMTADAFENDRERTFNAGMNDHIIKPIEPEELYKTLSNFLSRGQMIA